MKDPAAYLLCTVCSSPSNHQHCPMFKPFLVSHRCREMLMIESRVFRVSSTFWGKQFGLPQVRGALHKGIERGSWFVACRQATDLQHMSYYGGASVQVQALSTSLKASSADPLIFIRPRSFHFKPETWTLRNDWKLSKLRLLLVDRQRRLSTRSNLDLPCASVLFPMGIDR